jgi:lysophospholipase L1-like esterase
MSAAESLRDGIPRINVQPDRHQGSDGRHRAQTFFVRLGLLLFSTAVALFIAEGVARLVAPRAISYPWMDYDGGMIVPLPNVQGRHFVPGAYDTTFSFNAQRFRGRSLYALVPDSGLVRIAVLGSSFVFGSGANDEESYPFRLQSLLRERARQKGLQPAYEVINAGIPGSTVADAALWYDRWVKQFHPQLVILNVACVVDFVSPTFGIDKDGKAVLRSPDRPGNSSGRSARRILRNIPGYILLSEHSELFNLLMLKVGELFRPKRNPVPQDDFALRSSGTQKGPLAAALSLEAAEIAWLNDDVNKSGGRLVVVILPCHENVDSTASPEGDEIRREYDEVVRVLQSVSAKESIPFYNVAPAMRHAAEQSSQPVYYAGWFETHPTSAGYSAIAREVAHFLWSTGLIDSP